MPSHVLHAITYKNEITEIDMSGFISKKAVFNTLACLAVGVIVAACGRPAGDGGAKPAKPADGAPAATTPLLLSAEDILVVSVNSLGSGPSITGAIQPERRADMRAEIAAVVVSVARENGDIVKRGDLLLRLDDTAIRDSLDSASAAVRAAKQAFDQAERQFQRVTTLRSSGMVSAQALDDAEVRRNNAQSDYVAAETRLVLARQQLTRTEIRAPFDGAVSDRRVSAGDTVQIGRELLKVIDPKSLRFEGLVAADAIGGVKPGQNVTFRVNGYGEQEFRGKVRRVNPAVNATTRQAEVLVDFSDGTQPKLAGLYAEGRIETESANVLTLPATALSREGDAAYAWRIAGDVVRKVPIQVGERDPRSGELVLKSGLSAGDRIIRQSGSTLKDGQKIEFAKPAASAQPAAAKP